MKIYRSDSLDPYENLRLEEKLLHQPSDEAILLFWRSESAVILGKNQNPWNECNLPYCTENHIKVARRITGGGTVYQDTGNLNYALSLPRSTYRMEDLLNQMCTAFQEVDIPATRFQANGLGIQDRKFSGHAFCYRQDKVLHHGTCLINSDLETLARSLNAKKSLDTHAVDSCRATTLNLSEYRQDLSQQQVEKIFIAGVEAYLDDQGTICENLSEVDDPSIPTTISDDEDWTYLKTPTFQINLSQGDVSVRRGSLELITSEASLKDEMKKLQGCRFTEVAVAAAISTMNNPKLKTALINEFKQFWLRP